VNDTEERNNDFLIDTRKRKTTSGKNDAHQLNPARITASKVAEETTFKERRFQHRKRHAETKRQQSTSQNGTQNNDVENDAHTNSQSTPRISESKRRKDDTQGRNDASRTIETQTETERQQALSRNGNRNNDVTDDASQIKAEDLRKQNRTGFYKRF
jgi:hypothetical protein